MLLPFRAKPRPSKKARQENTAEENAPSEPDAALNVDATILEDLVDDPPIRDEVVAPEEDFVNPSGPTDQFVVTTHIDKNIHVEKPLERPTGSVQANDPKDDEVVITGEGRTEPGNPVALPKHTAKEEMSALNKGKWDVDLATYSALSAQDIHSGYLNRLYTSRDYEANLVKMMKDKFEVTFMPSLLLLTTIAPKGRFNFSIIESRLIIFTP